MSEVVGRVLTHDTISLPIVTDDRAHVILFATAGLAAGTIPVKHPIPEAARHLFTDRWDFEVVDDMLAEPERHPFNAPLGFRAMLRVPIRLQDDVIALLVVMARDPAIYQSADAGRGPSYRRLRGPGALAPAARRSSPFRRGAARTSGRPRAGGRPADDAHGRGELPEEFDRISAIARKVLAHDTLVLTVVLPDGKRARVYASSSVDGKAFPEVLDLPDDYVRDPKWDHVIVDDLPADPVFRDRESARRGYRSALRVAVRVEGKLAGAFVFFSFTPAAYKVKRPTCSSRGASGTASCWT